MRNPVRTVSWSQDLRERRDQLLSREWLVTSGNGSYASGTLGFVPTRRHHGLLIANLPAPQGRTMSLVQLRDEVVGPGLPYRVRLWGAETSTGGVSVHSQESLTEFRLECGFPVWTYQFAEAVLEKSIVMPYQSHLVCVRYRMIEGAEPLELSLRPLVQFRGHNESVATPCQTQTRSHGDNLYTIQGSESGHQLFARVESPTCHFVTEDLTQEACFYRVEAARGYDHVGSLHSSGYFTTELVPDGQVVFAASLDEEWKPDNAACFGEALFREEYKRRQQLIDAAQIHEGDQLTAELALAADQFVIAPVARQADHPDADPAASEPIRRSIIAGYPWFTDWGRDTMISLPGLTLATHRPGEARRILLTFADYIQDGLIPNLFPEGGQEGLYHTADATLWYFQALHEYESATGDQQLVAELLPKLSEIVCAHQQGTRFGIRVDAADGLLVQGEEGFQLTWMDAKAGDWVVTPRRGKAVEINALWYNAIHLYCDWLKRYGDAEEVPKWEATLSQIRDSFNELFWYAEGGYLYDVIEGDVDRDASLRPNQLFAISLEHAVLQPHRWSSVLDVVLENLLTPVGLRSLAPSDDAYLGQYRGDVYRRDAAYHQGTVWSWLIGPFVRAWVRTFPERKSEAMPWLAGLEAHLGEACIGQVSEVFEGDAPHDAVGCFAQAWGVAELLSVRRRWFVPNQG